MPELTFQIKTWNGEVPTHTFREAIQNAFALLREFDVGISRKRSGTLVWNVSKLKSNGDFSLSFRSHLKLQALKLQLPDIGSSVANNLLTGFEDLEEKCETPPYLSEAGLIRAANLSDLIGAKGAEGFRFTLADRVVEITPKTADNVNKLLPTKRTAIGSVEGFLEEINVHRRSRKADTPMRFIVYHAITNKAITCLFSEDKLEEVKNALAKRVAVFGELQKNFKGDTMRIQMDRLEVLESKKRFVLPDMGGDVESTSFENALSTKDYMRRIRGG